MTDSPPDDDPGPGIALDAHGDPVRQGSLMVERQSYERVVEGLKSAAVACMHLAAREPSREGVDSRRGLALKLDQCRRMCIQHAGIDDPSRVSPTEQVRGEPMAFRVARDQLVEGLTQAAGGARQLATCFRIDLLWSRVAVQLETLARNVRNPRRTAKYDAGANAGHRLILPDGYTRH
jgi:hypothetical protein